MCFRSRIYSQAMVPVREGIVVCIGNRVRDWLTSSVRQRCKWCLDRSTIVFAAYTDADPERVNINNRLVPGSRPRRRFRTHSLEQLGWKGWPRCKTVSDAFSMILMTRLIVDCEQRSGQRGKGFVGVILPQIKQGSFQSSLCKGELVRSCVWPVPGQVKVLSGQES